MPTLQPLAMIAPSTRAIYAPSRLQPTKTITAAEFLESYADHSRVILVSNAADGVSDPQRMTAYGFGWDCWYVVV